MSSSYAGLLGTGIDGSMVLDGTATVSWATLSSNVYTMTRDCYMQTLVIDSGVTLTPAGYRIFCQNTLVNDGSIEIDPIDGKNPPIQRNTPFGTIGGGLANTNSSTAAGENGFGYGSPFFSVVEIPPAFGRGGEGGSSFSGGVPFASGGNYGDSIMNNIGITDPTPYIMNPYSLLSGSFTIQNRLASLETPGAGSGAGDGTNRGGGGGSGAGIIVIYADEIINNGTISVRGGNGQAAPAGGDCGGGGGGAGGYIFLYTVKLFATWNFGTTVVAGGTGGSGSGMGTAGQDGTDGAVINVLLS